MPEEKYTYLHFFKDFALIPPSLVSALSTKKYCFSLIGHDARQCHTKSTQGQTQLYSIEISVDSLEKMYKVRVYIFNDSRA